MSKKASEIRTEYDFGDARRGPIATGGRGRKTRITIRLDDEILDWFRGQVESQGGGSYQALINDALRNHIARQAYSWEDRLRHVLREELSRYESGDG